MTFFEDLQARGLISQTTHAEVADHLHSASRVVYAGFDPTSDSLHVGTLLGLMTLRRFQKAGHRPIAVVGGATGMIGDPSGKSQERNLLNREQLDLNVKGISRVIERFLETKGPQAATLANNADWTQNLSCIDFLRDIGKHFTINYMLAKDSVKLRLEDRENGLSYTEFSYMLFQAFDFQHLHQTQNCSVQLGGADQWGNITAGTELIRRKAAHASAKPSEEAAPIAFGLTWPLVTKSDGTKFGKTESGTIWLTADRTSPYQFYQFWVRTQDSDVIKFLKWFTFLPLADIAQLEAALKTAPEKREAQTALARELVKIVHGEEELKRVEAATQALYGTDLSQLDAKTLLDVFADAPATQKPLSSLDVEGGLSLVELLAETKLCSSKGEAKKDLTAGAIYLNHQKIQEAGLKVQPSHLLHGKYLVLRRGKKNHHLVSFE